MNIVVVGKLYREILGRFDFDAEDEVAEKIVGKLCHFGGILRFPGDGVGLNKGIIDTIVAHIPTVKVVQCDMVAQGHVF